MKIGFYPGCSLKGMSCEYTESLKAITNEAGIELIELSDWNCCGATAAHNFDRKLSLSLPARIIAQAEEDGFSQILVPCAACYGRLATTLSLLNKDEVLKNEICENISKPISGKLEIINILQFINLVYKDIIQPKIKYSLPLKAACYYGCLLVRPHDVLNFDRSEDPLVMDKIMKEIGAEPIDWPFKTECCGAGLSVSKTNVVAKLSGKIITEVMDRNADVIVVACPMCHSNLDMRRPEIEKIINKKSDIPVIYITQAIGLAMGIKGEMLGFNRHFVPVKIHSKLLINSI